ncbi:MAG: response regulator transcription factor [Bacteroidales bacterium]|nr:response regulator transcription factor [Bacteroidales bacterium]
MERISVVLVDDHKLFREGLILLLKNISLVNEIHEAADGNDFMDSMKQGEKPDIVFMDIDMPNLNGIEATRQALQMYPDLKIIALSMYSDEDYYTQMIEAGVKGFILKNSGIRDVELAIQYVMEGKNYFSQEILDSLLVNLNRNKQPLKKTDLSDREEEVLYHICKGLSNQEIADRLFISKRTVDKHRENLLFKTGSNNTAGLVMFAIKNKIVEI